MTTAAGCVAGAPLWGGWIGLVGAVWGRSRTARCRLRLGSASAGLAAGGLRGPQRVGGLVGGTEGRRVTEAGREAEDQAPARADDAGGDAEQQAPQRLRRAAQGRSLRRPAGRSGLGAEVAGHGGQAECQQRGPEPDAVGVLAAGGEVPERLAELGLLEALPDLGAVAVEVLDAPCRALRVGGCRL